MKPDCASISLWEGILTSLMLSSLVVVMLVRASVSWFQMYQTNRASIQKICRTISDEHYGACISTNIFLVWPCIKPYICVHFFI